MLDGPTSQRSVAMATLGRTRWLSGTRSANPIKNPSVLRSVCLKTGSVRRKEGGGGLFTHPRLHAGLHRRCGRGRGRCQRHRFLFGTIKSSSCFGDLRPNGGAAAPGFSPAAPSSWPPAACRPPPPCCPTAVESVGGGGEKRVTFALIDAVPLLFPCRTSRWRHSGAACNYRL